MNSKPASWLQEQHPLLGSTVEWIAITTRSVSEVLDGHVRDGAAQKNSCGSFEPQLIQRIVVLNLEVTASTTAAESTTESAAAATATAAGCVVCIAEDVERLNFGNR